MIKPFWERNRWIHLLEGGFRVTVWPYLDKHPEGALRLPDFRRINVELFSDGQDSQHMRTAANWEFVQ